MNRDHFRVLEVDLSDNSSTLHQLDGRNEAVGGSGLAALLFERFGASEAPWNHDGQPLILAIGPLTGAFPLMSKTVAGFKSPYHNQYTESHAGGRLAMSLLFAGLDALVVRGRAERLSILEIGSRHVSISKASFLQGLDSDDTGKLLRRMSRARSGHRSILRIGPAGERCSPMACINVDTYRHFGRLGSGAVMGTKNLKGIIIQGDSAHDLPSGSRYPKLVAGIHETMTRSGMMRKYHNLGTPANLALLDRMKSLPWRNLLQSSDPDSIDSITGENFAREALLRNSACSGCPVGCIHIGYFREKFQEDNRFLYRQVAYDYEPIFSCGSMLGIAEPVKILQIIDAMEKVCIDAISGGVALAWATEALENRLISTEQTMTPLRFGDHLGYVQAVRHLGTGANEFYRNLSRGVLHAAQIYGGKDFACVLGQEMAGYATGEAALVAQAGGFRHSHLDSGGYSYDMHFPEKDLEKTISFLLDDEKSRALLCSMVSCLFAREVYTEELLAECLQATGYETIANNLDTLAAAIQQKRWQLRFATGFSPDQITLPKRYHKIVTANGPIDSGYLNVLHQGYGQAIKKLVGTNLDKTSTP